MTACAWQVAETVLQAFLESGFVLARSEHLTDITLLAMSRTFTWHVEWSELYGLQCRS